MEEDSQAAQSYKAMARSYAGGLAKLVKDNVPAFDAVVSPPSKRCDAVMYSNIPLLESGWSYSRRSHRA
jgi:hypothetical protein